MNATRRALGILTAGLALGAACIGLALRGRVAPSPATYAPPESLPSLLATTRVSLARDFTLEQLAAETGRATGLPVRARWDVIDRFGVTTGCTVPHALEGVRLHDALRISGESLGIAPSRSLDARVIDGTIELATRDYFDRLELTQTAYDLSAYARSRSLGAERPRRESQQAMDELSGLITGSVEPETWLDNGGTLATLNIVDQTLIISAPPRMHHHIRWLLGTLAANPIRDRAGPERHGCFGP